MRSLFLIAVSITALAAADHAAEARTLFDNLCSMCHGKTGLADTPTAQALNPKPASFADATWQASVTDEHIETVILKGGVAVGKSPMMPGNPGLAEKPEVVAELRKIIRAFNPE